MWPFHDKGGGAQAPPSTAVSGVPEVYVLGGRRFVSVGESTVEHDFWFMGRIGEAGLREIVIGEHEGPDAFATRILMDILRDPSAVCELIGGLVIPEGKTGLDWTPAMAAETGAFLGALHSAEDKQALNTLVNSLLIYFFATGLVSLARSQGSSGTLDQPERVEPDEPTAMDAGASSSAPWPATTTSAQSG